MENKNNKIKLENIEFIFLNDIYFSKIGKKYKVFTVNNKKIQKAIDHDPSEYL